jgi:tetratricopeptide (TPR) repeat protein
MSDTPAPVHQLSLPGLEAMSGTLRSVFVNLGFFAAMLLLIPAVASQFSRNAVVIEPIAVPQALADRGLNADVVANRLWDGLQDFASTARIARATITAIPDSQLVEFSLPDTGISVDSIFKQVRQFFGVYETHIAGEIICETADCAPAGLRLRLRVMRGTAEIIDLPPIGDKLEQDYFRDAATGIFDVLDPLVAIAARSVTDPQGAATRARRLALSNSPDAKWAHNLLGDIARNGGDPATAISDYQAALTLDDSFNLARIGLGRALAASGDLDGATKALDDATARDPSTVALHSARAELALLAGHHANALNELLTASEIDPLDPALLARAGEQELALDLRDDAVRHLTEALNLDPGQPDALRLLGGAYRTDGDLAAAERLFKDWADYQPDSAEAHLALAEILVERNDLDKAVEHYNRLVALLPDNVEHAIARARLLLTLKRYAQAVDGLTPFADADPAIPAAVLLLAQIQQAAGRKDHAITRYQQFLTLEIGDNERTEAEAALVELGREPKPASQ